MKYHKNVNYHKIPSMPALPKNFEQIRSTILTGAKSFIPKLPRPLIHRKGNHAYVLPSKCICLFLANGNIPMEFDNMLETDIYSSPKETPRGVDIAKKIAGIPVAQNQVDI